MNNRFQQRYREYEILSSFEASNILSDTVVVVIVIVVNVTDFVVVGFAVAVDAVAAVLNSLSSQVIMYCCYYLCNCCYHVLLLSINSQVRGSLQS